MDYQKLADLLFPNVKMTPGDMEDRFPPRQLADGAAVTRIAPSPTGWMHFGVLFPAMTAERLAHQSGGVFYLRIEDTDNKREVPGAVEMIIDSLNYYKLHFDEGAVTEAAGLDKGAYGPYRQRGRADIYHVFAKKLVTEGKAYPCFCTEQELSDIRAEQEAKKANFGYYGEWAKYRDRPFDEIERLIKEGRTYTLRFRSEGSIENKLKFTDLIRGELEITENDIDHVLLKSDGIPTYHFAHAVDDHLMRTTHVIRGEEWLPSLPLHLQLFDALGWKRPKYMHISNLMKMDGDSKRKISKRKDPEASLGFFQEAGYPVEAVREYVINTLNSNFEEWRRANPEADLTEFKFSVKKMSVSGALFDPDKLSDISKNVISRMTADEVYVQAADWSGKYDTELHGLLTRDPSYTKAILAIGRGGKKPRKDIAVWSGLKDYMGFFFDELFGPEYIYPENIRKSDIAAILESYLADYSGSFADQSEWFDDVKKLSEKLGFCPDTKQYKAEPESWKGHAGDVSMVIRVAVCGKQQSPDLFAVMDIMGSDMVKRRLKMAADALISANPQ